MLVIKIWRNALSTLSIFPKNIEILYRIGQIFNAVTINETYDDYEKIGVDDKYWEKYKEYFLDEIKIQPYKNGTIIVPIPKYYDKIIKYCNNYWYMLPGFNPNTKQIN